MTDNGGVMAADARAPGGSTEDPPFGQAFVDIADRDQVSGWALFSDGLEVIDILVEGRRVGTAEYGQLRLDVAEGCPEIPGSSHSGFSYNFRPDDFAEVRGGLASVCLEFRSRGGTVLRCERFEIPTVSLSRRFASPGSADEDVSAGAAPSPFPREAMQVLRELRGEAVYGGDPWTLEKMEEAVDDLIFVFRRASRETRGIFRYFAYLLEIWTRLEFNARNFPRVNRSAEKGAKDRCGVATSPVELFAIAHHLATLKSHGVDGKLCEFGCFKGFSTACLSEACFRLGMTMDVFDSFAGLPDSDSEQYCEGDFMGSLEEVSGNVEEFGKLSVVRFHRGFFSETLPHYLDPKVACLWMDVDLEASAQDVMTLLPSLSPHSCVFSDECEPADFSDGSVITEPGPDNVIPPIVEAFTRAGRRLTGSFVAGHTGVFRDADRGIPVLEAAPLLRLKDALLGR